MAGVMAGVVLVSHDPAAGLAVAGREPGWSLVLLDGAATAARASHPGAAALRRAITAGTVVAVHDEAALRRGLTSGELVEGIKTADLDEIADLVAEARGPVVWL